LEFAVGLVSILVMVNTMTPRKPNYKDLLKKFKKRNIKNPERIATAYVKGLTSGSKKRLLKI